MTPETVLVHVRFAPNGSVVEIGERPSSLNPQQWFNSLSERAGAHYQAYAGGRGLFRIPRAEIEEFKIQSAA
ncbi:MAG: hypothetical protein P4L76_16840 [Beijerinckiaceae bacterium]|nr:hypothetical protein [Beijerinckiaceae bacterium]